MSATPRGLAVTRTAEGVWHWELCEPERRNPVGPALLDWIATTCPTLHGDVVVLCARTRDDDRTPVFCAGFDLAALAEASHDAMPDAPLGRAVAAMRAADATFVAAVHGRVIGAGVELVVACDVRIATDAVDFEIPAARLGVVYRAEGLALLQRAFGPAVSARLVLLGERIDARTAALAGAVTHVCAPAELVATRDRIASGLRASAPLGLAGNRDLLRALVPAVPDHVLAEHERKRRAAFAGATARARPAPDAALVGSRPMGIRDEIDTRLRQARRDRDEKTLNVIGMIKNKVLMELKSGSGATETDELWKSILAAYAKQLRKSIPEFEKVGERGKEALAEVEFELGFVEQFLPAKLDEAATEALVRRLVDENGLAGQGAKATGRLMGLLMKQHKDEIDGEIAKTVVARVLG